MLKMVEIQIEKDVPLPEPSRRKKGESVYPFRKMEIGDSCVISKDGRKSWDFLYAAINKAQNDLNIKLTTRQIDDENKRVWRVA